ncbi:MAG: DUF3465 domain-containing protein [Planctomycetota bacterium]|nr:DUF3465 domain-containing protein [Planctomycetota bacterium]
MAGPKGRNQTGGGKAAKSLLGLVISIAALLAAYQIATEKGHLTAGPLAAPPEASESNLPGLDDSRSAIDAPIGDAAAEDNTSDSGSPSTSPAPTGGTSSRAPSDATAQTDALRASNSQNVVTIAQLFRERRSNVWVEAAGRVERVLADDSTGSPHQRFIVKVEGGPTVLVAHNLEGSDRVPAQPGDLVRFRGEYEYTDRGGTVHFTHRPMFGRKKDVATAGGWIDHKGTRYD